MTYKYLSIQFDSQYSIETTTSDLVKYIRTIPELKQTDKVEFKNKSNYPWGVVLLVKCDERGRYSVDKGESFESINLIEFLFSDTKASLKHYLIIASRIAKKLNWQLVDEDTNEILVEKK